MNTNPNLILNAHAQATLNCLRNAVSKALDRKRRLGHYSVQYSGGRVFAVGDDAPDYLRLVEDVAQEHFRVQQSENDLNSDST